jgi:hypothetical protein
MAILWRGVGFLVLVLAIGCVWGAQYLTGRFAGGAYWVHNGWPLMAGMLVAAALSWLIGRRLNKPARKDADPRRPWTHDLLFIRMEWWAFPLAALAVAVFVTGWKPGDSARTVKAATDAAKVTTTK